MDGRLKVWVTAPPTDGQANEAVCKVVAKQLGVAPSNVCVLRGDSAREKVLRITGMSLVDAMKRLSGV